MSTQSTHHVPEPLIGRYANGDTGIPVDQVWALEAHLEGCAVCRGRLAGALGDEMNSLVGGVWSGLEPLLPGIVPTPPRRHRAPGLAAWVSPVMTPWLCTTVFAALLAVVFDLLVGSSAADPGLGFSLALLLAPVLPALGVAASWAGAADPAYELTAATPRAGLQLILRRTTSVLVVVIPPLVAASWLTGSGVALWLLPCLTFTTGTLALGALVGVTRAAAALVMTWAALIVAPTLAVGRISFALHTDAWPGWGAAFVLGAVVVVARRGAYTRLGAGR